MIGRELGQYRILEKLGQGGMGEVYRARDTRLKRDVALKILPDSFASDVDRVARFQREAEVLASLNHPHIATIHGLEETDGVRALVLELVEGDTLADRIASGPIPLDEALPIARQIAEALEVAHEHGVVHRDLKPANIKIRPNGDVKVLDFGLAKLTEPAAAGPSGHAPTMSPTLTSPAGMTGVGMLLGTAGYMSPEQAKGQPADGRSDVWAFGCVLYEMLTGKSTFNGDGVMETLSAVLRADPHWAVLPSATPPSVRSLLRRCLQKDRRQRLHDIGDARIEIDDVLRGPLSAPSNAAARKAPLALWAGATVAVMVLTAVAVLYFQSAQEQAPEARLQIVTPRAARPASFAVSPDGRAVVYEASEGATQLWLRRLDDETATPLSGTDGAQFPFWSPDGRSVAFFADQKLKRKDIAGGTALALADASGETFGGTWNADGTILFAPSNTSPLYRVSDRGGQPEEATRLASPQQGGHRFPHFLPDGRRFLFFATGTPAVLGVYAGSLDSKETRRLFASDSAPVFAPPDRVLFVRQGTLFAQQIDLATLAATGDPFLVAERIFVGTLSGIASVAVSASKAGPLAYRNVEAPRQLIWFDRAGKQVGVLGSPDAALETNPIRLSPDERYVALPRAVSGNVDIFILDIARTTLRRFTFDAAQESAPVWSPKGDRLAFHSYRKGLNDLFEKPVADSNVERVLLESTENKNISDWSSDGRFVLYATQNPKSSRDVWALPLDGDRKPVAVANSSFEERSARFSPDGQWVAYQSNESGRFEILVKPFPGPGGSVQVSTTGGTDVEWRGDGRELFYIGPGNRLMAVAVSNKASGTTFTAGAPSVLFPLRPGSFYTASRDGQRFLVSGSVEDNPTAPITMVLNWAGRRGQ